jgi:hypothetical protein
MTHRVVITPHVGDPAWLWVAVDGESEPDWYVQSVDDRVPERHHLTYLQVVDLLQSWGYPCCMMTTDQFDRVEEAVCQLDKALKDFALCAREPRGTVPAAGPQPSK